MQDTYNPTLHRVNQAIRFRAIHPDKPVPPPYDILIKYMNPPDELMEKAMPIIERVRVAADVKKGMLLKPRVRHYGLADV